MIDTVELQQIITNLPSVEKVASSSNVLAVNLANSTQKEMEIADEAAINTVVELSEVLEPVNDKEKNPKKEENKNNNPLEQEREENSADENKPHVDLVV